MDSLRILKKARALLSDKSKWTSGSLARDKGGYQTGPLASDAKQFCAYGACYKVSKIRSLRIEESPFSRSLEEAAKRLIKEFSGKEIIALSSAVAINDMFGYEKTIEMFDLAICIEECATSQSPEEIGNQSSGEPK